MPIRSGSRSKTGKLFRYPSGHRCRVVLAADPRRDLGPIPSALQDRFRRRFLTRQCGESGTARGYVLVVRGARIAGYCAVSGEVKSAPPTASGGVGTLHPCKEGAGVKGVDGKSAYVPLPRTEVTFSGEQATKTVTVDEKGFYQLDLAVGVYKMTAQGPTVGAQPLKKYGRLFRVKSPTRVVLNGSLYKARTTCDVLVGGDTEEQKIDEWKNQCGGEDSFPVPSKDGAPLQLYIQYPQRQPSDRGYLYTSNKITEPDVPVFVAY